MSEWRQARWGDVATLAYGRALSGYKDREPTHVRVYGTNGPIGYTDVALAPGPGVVVGRKGAYRGIHYSTGDFFVIDTAFYLKPLEELDLRWAYYELLTHDINGLDSGSAIPSTSRESFYSLSVTVPPIQEQRAIAGVLGALDDKIESNRRLAALATELAKTELLGAPSGRVVRLGDVAAISKGLSYKGDGLADAGVPMVNMGNAANFGWLKRSGFKFYTGAYKPKHIAHPGDVLVVNTEQTWRNEIIGWPLLVPSDAGDVLFTHHIFRADFTPGFEGLRLPYWASLFEPTTRAMLDSMVYGTTVATLPAEALERVEIRVPEDEGVVDSASALLARVWEAERETANVESLRDALLPELLSGRLRVGDAERLMKGAL